MDYIRLEDIRIFARHGCLPEESLTGTEFSVTLRIGLDLEKAGRTDKVEYTVNYAELLKAVYEEMEKPSKLLENAAWRLKERILNDFPLVETVEVRLAKLHPPLKGKIAKSEVIYTAERSKE